LSRKEFNHQGHQGHQEEKDHDQADDEWIKQ
jgi:hypothetical protein